MAGDGAMRPTITIREARESDLPRLLEIYAGDDLGGHRRAAGDGDLARVRSAFERITASEYNHLFVAEWDGTVVGTFQLTLIPGLVAAGRIRAKIESVHVAPEWRGRGIGGAMMVFAEAEARRRGAGLMELTSNLVRLDAHRFYERLGFVKSHAGFKKPID